MRALLIVNPNATTTTAAARDLLAHALASRTALTVGHTTHAGHASEMARQARLSGVDLVIVHGGDGTVNEVVNGLLGTPAPTSMQSVTVGPVPLLAVVPGGSANVFARSLGIERYPLEATNQLIDLLGTGDTRRIGLGHCDGRWFLFNSGVGLDAEVCEAIDRSRRDGGGVSPARYVRASVQSFFRTKRRPPRLTIEVAGEEPVYGVHYAFVSNSDPWTYLDARPIHTNPETDFDSGLGVFAMRTTAVVPSLHVARQMLYSTKAPRSKYLFRVDDVPTVTITASEPTGLQLDGDYMGLRDRVEFHSAADALVVVAPAG